MTTRNQIQATQAVQDYTRRNARLIYYGVLGNNAGTVNHATRNDWVYVRLHGDSNQVVEALAAASFPHVNNVVVDVEKVTRKGAPYYQVLGVSAGITYATTDNPFAGMPGYHASTHQRRDRNVGGPDPLDVYNRALVNLRARAQVPPAMTLYVERGFYVITSFKEWTGGNSAAFTVIAPFFVRWDLLYLGNDDALHILEGTAVLSSSTPVYPTVPANCIPIAYVYRSSDQAYLDEADLTDARTILSSNQATAAAHNLLSAVHGDTLAASVAAGAVVIGNDTPKWSSLAIAVPAANVRNVLGVDNGETKPSWKTALDGTNPVTLTVSVAAAPGTSLVFAHRDHAHAITSSSNPGAAAALLASDASGFVTVQKAIAKPSGAAGIQLDPNSATGDFTLSLSPANLTGNRRTTFPNRDLNLDQWVIPMSQADASFPVVGTNKYPFYASMPRTLTHVSFVVSVYVATTNSASHYYTFTLEDANHSGASALATFNTSAIAADTWTLFTVSSFNPTTSGTADKWVNLRVLSATGTPGTLYVVGPIWTVAG